MVPSSPIDMALPIFLLSHRKQERPAHLDIETTGPQDWEHAQVWPRAKQLIKAKGTES